MPGFPASVPGLGADGLFQVAQAEGLLQQAIDRDRRPRSPQVQAVTTTFAPGWTERISQGSDTDGFFRWRLVMTTS